MEGFLVKAGVIAVVLLIIFVIKMIDDYLNYKKINHEAKETMGQNDDKIVLAANAFAQGASADKIREMLINHIDFDEESIEEILTISMPHRADNDGGYSAFLEAVDKTLEAYI